MCRESPCAGGPGRRPAPPSAAAAGARVHAQDAAAMQVQEVEDLRGHGVEAGPGLDVVDKESTRLSNSVHTRAI